MCHVQPAAVRADRVHAMCCGTRIQAPPEGMAKRVPSQAARPVGLPGLGQPQVGLSMSPEELHQVQHFALKKKAPGKGSGRFLGGGSLRSSVIMFNGGCSGYGRCLLHGRCLHVSILGQVVRESWG